MWCRRFRSSQWQRIYWEQCHFEVQLHFLSTKIHQHKEDHLFLEKYKIGVRLLYTSGLPTRRGLFFAMLLLLMLRLWLQWTTVFIFTINHLISYAVKYNIVEKARHNFQNHKVTSSHWVLYFWLDEKKQRLFIYHCKEKAILQQFLDYQNREQLNFFGSFDFFWLIIASLHEAPF